MGFPVHRCQLLDLQVRVGHCAACASGAEDQADSGEGDIP
jgi:hypothetical protein